MDPKSVAGVAVVVFLVGLTIGAGIEAWYSHEMPAWYIGVAGSSIAACLNYVYKKNGNGNGH